MEHVYLQRLSEHTGCASALLMMSVSLCRALVPRVNAGGNINAYFGTKDGVLRALSVLVFQVTGFSG